MENRRKTIFTIGVLQFKLEVLFEGKKKRTELLPICISLLNGNFSITPMLR